MTYTPKSDFLTVMLERGFVADCTDYEGFDKALCDGVVPGYIGFDANAENVRNEVADVRLLRPNHRESGVEIDRRLSNDHVHAIP